MEKGQKKVSVSRNDKLHVSIKCYHHHMPHFLRRSPPSLPQEVHYRLNPGILPSLGSVLVNFR